MNWGTALALWALIDAAAMVTIRNLYGEEAALAWAPVVLLAVTAPFLLWKRRQ